MALSNHIVWNIGALVNTVTYHAKRCAVDNDRVALHNVVGPWAEEPGRPQSMGSGRVEHD